jgi:hypothetical protein
MIQADRGHTRLCKLGHGDSQNGNIRRSKMPCAGNPHNPCGKTVTRENAYEVWRTPDGSWTWYVLKKYQSPEKEAQNPYARWFCDVVSPFVGEAGEMGDVYVHDIKGSAVKISERKTPVPTPPGKTRSKPKKARAAKPKRSSPPVSVMGIYKRGAGR